MEQRKGAYVWEFPVRLTHWINMLSILTLSVTGFYIGRPFVHAVSSGQYIMGWMRFIHFASAYAFLLSFIIRLYWAFMGNRHASWRVFLPLTKRQRRDLIEAVKFYSFVSRKPPHAVGHTALGGAFYLVMFLLFVFEIASGFALYGLSKHGGVVWTALGGWLLSVMHISTVRLFHHLSMYAILVLSALHIYIAWYVDTVEKNGVMGSIFGGYKFITGKELK